MVIQSQDGQRVLWERGRGEGGSVSEELGRAGKSWEDSDKFCSSLREEATFVEAMEGKIKKK